jgi:ribose 1,5-bisphosphokinase PhnN
LVDDDLEKGRVVVINVSSTIIEEDRRRYPQTRVINVTIKLEILEQRLRDRGRESEAEIQERIERSQMFDLDGENMIEFANNLSI